MLYDTALMKLFLRWELPRSFQLRCTRDRRGLLAKQLPSQSVLLALVAAGVPIHETNFCAETER